VRWEDVDLDATEHVVRITGTVVRVKGVGLVRQGEGKTQASTRKVALPPWLAERLAGRRGARAGSAGCP